MSQIFFGGGRIGRLHYFLMNVGLSVLGVVLFQATGVDNPVTGEFEATADTFLVWLPLVWLSAATALRRIHDRNHSAAFLVLLFVPVLNLVAGLYLLFAPSYDVVNRHGPPAEGHEPAPQADRVAMIESDWAEVGHDSESRERHLVHDDGSFDMDGLFKDNPGARHD
jgi:uncharacterized membrane protein YhaH (DUF805 family)